MRSLHTPLTSRLRALALVLPLAASTALVACGSDGTSGTCSTSGTGNLVVTVSGLPAGVNANVKVTGPTGSSQVLTGSQTLTGTAGGSYAVTAGKVVVADPIVRTVYIGTVSSASACVASGGTQTVTVTYKQVPTSNKIWLTTSNAPNGQGTVGISSANLAATGSPAASAAVDTPVGRHIAFDRDGNLWANGGTTVDPTLLRMPADSLATSGKQSPDLKINVSGLDCAPGVGGIAFDASGALWFAAPCKKVIYKLGANQLVASADVTPALTIPFADGAEGLAFDKAGNLWVGTGKAAARFDAAALGSASATPSLTIAVSTKATGGAELHPGWLAFDGSGNLWSNDFGGNVVYTIPSTELSATGSKTVVPPALVTLEVGALLGGMAFDEGGGLWIAYSAGKFIRLAPAQLTVTTGPGNPTVPERIISSPQVAYVEDLAFYPGATGTPLFSATP